jgi:DNA-binding NarL/FixJ family response regulator
LLAKIVNAQKDARPIAWIDSYVATRESVKVALSNMDPDLAIASFNGVSEAIKESATDWSLAVYHHHQSDGDLTALVTTLRAALRTSGILILSDFADPQQIQEMRINAPQTAFGLLSMTTSGLRTLYAAMQFVRAGGTFFPLDAPEFNDTRDARLQANSLGPDAALSPREEQVLAGVKAGQTNKAIALDLGLSESTVKAHVRSLLRKTGAANRIQTAVRRRGNVDRE